MTTWNSCCFVQALLLAQQFEIKHLLFFLKLTTLFHPRSCQESPATCCNFLEQCQSWNASTKAVRVASNQKELHWSERCSAQGQVPWHHSEGSYSEYPGCCGDCFLVFRWRGHRKKKFDWLQCVKNVQDVLIVSIFLNWVCHKAFWCLCKKIGFVFLVSWPSK